MREKSGKQSHFSGPDKLGSLLAPKITKADCWVVFDMLRTNRFAGLVCSVFSLGFRARHDNQYLIFPPG